MKDSQKLRKGWPVVLGQGAVLIAALLIGVGAAWQLQPPLPGPLSYKQEIWPVSLDSIDHRALKLNVARFGFPPAWDHGQSIKQRKHAFVDRLRPLVRLANARLAEDRKRLTILFESNKLNRREAWLLASFYHHYRVEPGDRNALLRRVDQLPADLILAQAALETNWGQSDLVQRGNALFGEWTWDAHEIIPGSEIKFNASQFGVRRFPSLYAALVSHMRNLNSNKAYLEMRILRAHARAEKRRPTGAELASGLARFAAKNSHYVERLRIIMRTELDHIKLADRNIRE